MLPTEADSGHIVTLWSELEVMVDGVNVATGKPVTASTSNIGAPARYTDGNSGLMAMNLNSVLGTWEYLQSI